MEHMNDNGQRPDEMHYQRMTRRRKRNIICLAIALLIPGLLLSLFVTTFFGFRRFHTPTVIMSDVTRVMEVRIHEAERTVLDELPHLTVVSRVGAASGDVRIAAEDVRYLNVNMRNGMFSIFVHDGDYLIIRSSSQINYDFDRHDGILDLSENRSSAITVHVPYSRQEALFDSIVIESRNGGVFIGGASQGETYFWQKTCIL